MTDHKQIGEKIKGKRIERKLTQEKLAEITELSVGYISDVETAKKKVSLNAILKICNALDTSISSLILEKQIFLSNDELACEFDSIGGNFECIQECYELIKTREKNLLVPKLKYGSSKSRSSRRIVLAQDQVFLCIA